MATYKKLCEQINSNAANAIFIDYLNHFKTKLIEQLENYFNASSLVSEKCAIAVTYSRILLSEKKCDECRKYLEFLENNTESKNSGIANLYQIASLYHELAENENNAQSKKDFDHAVKLGNNQALLEKASHAINNQQASNYQEAADCYYQAIVNTQDEKTIQAALEGMKVCLEKTGKPVSLNAIAKLVIFNRDQADHQQKYKHLYKPFFENLEKTYHYIPAKYMLLKNDAQHSI